MVVFCSIALFSLHVGGSHSDSTPDRRRVPLCVHDYRAFRTVQAALQTATAVVSKHELVSCGTGGTLCCRWVDTRGHVSSVCALISFQCAPSSRVFLGGNASSQPNFDFLWFSDLPRAPAPLCDHGLGFGDEFM